MKVRFLTQWYGPSGTIGDLPEDQARALIKSGDVEAIEQSGLVERTTQAPGEKRPVSRPRKVEE